MKRTPLIEELTIGPRGELVLPRRLRRALAWQAGDRLLVTVADGRLVAERRVRSLGAVLEVLVGASGGRENG